MAVKAHIEKRSRRKADVPSSFAVDGTATSEYPLLIATALAVAVPLMWAYQQPPLPAFYSQLVACALWSLVLLIASRGMRVTLQASNSSSVIRTVSTFSGSGLLVCAIWGGLLALAVAHGAVGLSPGFVLAPIAFNLMLAALISLAVLTGGGEASLRRWLAALLVGVLFAALFNSFVALVQSFAPNWTHDAWIASSAPANDRVGGNLRQPNQLATLMLWGLLAATFLLRGVVGLWLVVCAPLVATLFATGSRTGVISLALILIAALLRSPRVRTWRKRSWLLLALSVIPLVWFAEIVFTRSTAEAALSQRLALWRDVIELIRQHPWSGVGMGQLNFAWTLTPLAARASDVFDHAHTLPLHLAVELGLPAATLILVLLALALWRSRVALRTRAGATAALLLAVVLVHSLVEYPLWFSYFLLPSAFLFAWLARIATTPGETAAGLVVAKANQIARRNWPQTLVRTALVIAALTLLATLFFAAKEYDKAVAIHRRISTPAALNATVETARSSPLFGQFGDYAAIMLAGETAPLAWFERPIRHVLDERLLVAYARALARAGDSERASFVIARAREFPSNRLFDALPTVAPTLSPNALASSPLGPRDFRR